MSNGLSSTYSDYQQASCQWLDSIPQHWIECRIKQIVSTPVTDGPHETPKFEDDGVPFLSAESVKNLKLDFARKRGFISSELHRQYSKKYVPRRGDIYMVKSGATTGALAIVETDEEFNIWSPLAAIRCRKDICFDRFVFYAMQSEFFQRSIELSWSFGTQQNIGMGVIENLFIARPPLPEQKQIASFLDYETAKIDALIEKQQQLIALLGEKRQAVISHAVTKGLNPDAPMIKSGISWAPDVPAHWSLVPNRSLFRIRRVLVGQRHSEYQLLSLTKRGVIVRDISTGDGKHSDYLERCQEVRPGDLVFCLFDVEETPRTIGLSNHLGMTSGDYTIMQCSDGLAARFVEYFYIAMDDRKLLRPLYRGLRKRIPKPGFLAARIPLPPPNEQELIVQHLDDMQVKLKRLVEAARNQVELLQERRTALISAAVTGKIDVRGWKRPSAAPKKETEMEVV
ncbi:restriction endonuclease subunit S [Rosistilla oblonga]|uniref:restriction endonuclease subunit S n=1 Tax=Rosistilla oblonga TaxID=2527990 RepID=UPI003A976DA6